MMEPSLFSPTWTVPFERAERCRYCRKRLRQTLECVPDRLEHHHLTFRSRGGQDESCNLVTLCLEHHIDAQQHRLLITGNPDEELEFTYVG